jgi:ankyrin repeat protein
LEHMFEMMRVSVKHFRLEKNYENLRNILSFRYDLTRVCDGNDWSLLHWAVQNDFNSVAELLLSYGASPNAQDK